MERKRIISEKPKCKCCGNIMKEWNPFTEVHEHIECSSDRISERLVKLIKKQLSEKVN